MNTKTFFLLMLLLSTFVVRAQSRQDRENLKFDGPAIGTLTQATGWRKNRQNGKWIDNQNFTSSEKLTSVEDISQCDNFKNITIFTLTNNNKKYYVFLYEAYSGNWKYPTIKQDWESWTETNFAVFPEADYLNFSKKINAKDGKNVYLKTAIYGSRIGKLSEGKKYEDDLMAEITNKFASPSYPAESLSFNCQTFDGKDIVRFIFLLDSEYATKNVMDGLYFECPLSDFKNILF